MSRLPAKREDSLIPSERRVWDRITDGIRGTEGELTNAEGGLIGPFNSFLYGPNLGYLVQEIGHEIRTIRSVPRDLVELAILTVAKKAHAEFTWWAHAPLAKNAGINPEAVEAIRDGEANPAFTDNRQATAHKFYAAVLSDHHEVDAGLYEDMITEVGHEGVVELVRILGYYTLISMVLTVFAVPLPPESQPRFSGRAKHLRNASTDE